MKKNINKVRYNIQKSPYRLGMDFFVFIFLFFPIIYVAQFNHVDSIKIALKTTPKFLLKLDSKFSFVSNQLVTMRGIKAGANFDDKIKLGIGYSWMKNNFVFDSPTSIINNEVYDLRYSYISVFGDYNFYIHNKWSYIINTDLAVVKLGYKNKKNKTSDYVAYGAVIEPSLIAEYNVIKYIVVGAGAGYRFVFRESRSIAEQFSAPIFIIRFKIDFPKIYKDVIQNK